MSILGQKKKKLTPQKMFLSFIVFIQAKNMKICSTCSICMFPSFTNAFTHDLISPYKELFRFA